MLRCAAVALLVGWVPCHGAAAKKRIVTTFTIIQDMAQNVAGEAATVESITKPGAEIHGYEPTPQDIVKAQKADLVLWNGLNLERWFERFFGNLQNVPSAVLTEGISPMGIAEGPYVGKPNPHAWMSPRNAVIYVENIRKALVKLDPANTATYHANAAAYTAKFTAIEMSVRAELEKIPAERRWLVSSEGAFPYLAQNFGMKELFLWAVNADQLDPRDALLVVSVDPRDVDLAVGSEAGRAILPDEVAQVRADLFPELADGRWIELLERAGLAWTG